MHGEALIALDKLDKIGVERVDKELRNRGVDADATLACLGFFSGVTRDDPHHAGGLERFRAFVKGHATDPQAVGELEELVRLAESTPARGRIRIDPSLARGLSYYTGAIMEIAVPDLAGSLGGGGRYDNLIGMFLGKDVPACGFSLGLERIIVVMTERGMFPATAGRRPADVMVAIWNEQSRGDDLALAADLRRGGLRVDVYPEADKLGKQFKYASSRHYAFVAVVGDQERAGGTVSIKDLRSGAQETVARAEAATFIATRVN